MTASFGRRAAMGLCVALTAARAPADTVTQPLQVYGLGQVQSVAFSTDGSKILLGATSNAYLHDAVTGERIRVFNGHAKWVSSVAFSPDGTQVLSGSDDNTAKLWDAATGAVL